MSKLELTDEQHRVLAEIVQREIGDLGMEIADTDRLAFRDQLKARRQHLRDALDQLNTADPAATGVDRN